MKFVEVPIEIAGQVQTTAASKAVHSARDSQNGFGSHFARNASVAAQRAWSIDKPTFSRDLKVHGAANAAKHVNLGAWADACSDSSDTSPPIASGLQASSFDPQQFLDLRSCCLASSPDCDAVANDVVVDSWAYCNWPAHGDDGSLSSAITGVPL